MNDLYSHLKERFKNPLFFSFAFSWIFINWEIIVALFWFDKTQIYHEGHLSIISFIKSHLNIWHSILFPFLFAVGYTILNPLIRNKIKVFYAKINAKGETDSLIAIKGNFIPIEKFLSQRNTIEQQYQELTKLIKDEGEIQNENDKLKINNQNLELRIRNMERDSGDLMERLSSINNTNILNGKWTLTFRLPGQTMAKQEIEIINSAIYRIDDFSQKSFVCDIVNFHYDSKKRKIFFIKKIDNPRIDPRKYLINDLSFDDTNKLTGKEDFDIEVEYTRKTTYPATIEFKN